MTFFDKIISKRKNIIISLIILTIISSITLFLIPNINSGHDLTFHLSRISAIKDNLELGIIGGYIYPNYLNGYGYANGLFYPDLFLYIPAILSYLGLNIITSYKIFLFLISFGSISTMYICVKNISKNTKSALISSFIYGFASYRLTDMFTRAALGETMAFLFAPLVIYGIYEIIYGDYKKFYILILGMSGLILSHLISTLLISIALVIICCVNIKKFIKEKKRILYLLISAIITICLTAYFTLPMIEQMIDNEFAFNNLEETSRLLGRSAPIWSIIIEFPYELIKSVWIPPGIGIGFALLIYYYFKNRKNNDKFTKLCFIIGILFLICSTNLFPWNLFQSLLAPIQFPWRLYFITVLFLSIGAGTMLSNNTNLIEKKTKYLFLIFLIPVITVSTTSFLEKNVKEVGNYNVSGGEYIPANTNKKSILERGEIITSTYPLEYTINRNGLELEIEYHKNEKNNSLELPLLYYKGYKAVTEENEINIYQTSNGLVGIDVDTSDGIINVSYEGTKIQKISKIISLVSLIILILYLKKDLFKNKKTIYYLLSFIIPASLITIIYACAGIYPFGQKSLLTVDLAGQYVAFFNAYKNIFSKGISIFYSFSKTLGGNMLSLITYYLLSPLNIILLLFDKINITEAIFLINIIKIGLCGLTSYIYFRKNFKDESIIPLVFSLVYALGAYNIVYSQNLMWLDGVIILPLVFLGIDKLLDKEKPMLFYSMLTLTIYCNYYIGYMTCIASLAYFIYKLYLKNNYKINLKNNKKDIICFFKYTLLALGTTMIILLPSALSLMSGKAEITINEFIPSQNYPLIKLLSRMFIGSFSVDDLSSGLPNIFISLCMISLVILYFFNSKIPKEEKKASLIFISLFVASFLFYSLDIVWHMFQHPAGFPYRYSFIYEFVLLIIAYKSYKKLKEIDKTIIKKIIFAILVITLIIDALIYNSNLYYRIIISGALMIFYIIYLNKKQNINKLIIVLISLEMTINSIIIVSSMKYQNKSEYVDFINSYGKTIDEIKEKDNSFYRIEKDYSYSTNDSLLLDYNGISHFSSTYEGINNELLGDYLGIFNRFYITNYNGSTPVTNSLFSIKYLLLNKKANYYNEIETTNNFTVYENQYSLPLGFMVNNKIKTLELEKYKPFENQNNILKAMTDKNIDVFHENENVTLELNNIENNSKTYKKIISNNSASIKYKIKVEHNGLLYAYISSEYEKKIDIKVNGKSIVDTSDQNNYNYNILELGDFNINDEVDFEIILLENSVKFDNTVFYTFDKNNFEELINILQNNNQLNIEEYDIDYIKGTINVEDNEILYTSIPLDEGWTIKIDGKKVKSTEIFNTLIGIELTKGEHTIEFSYTPKGLYIGGIISILSIIFVILQKKHYLEK